mmetsp:Transcript_99069/g.170603  ORF Transcript_99069/g.170603 Transcript_99069/m.170603 type:complete len:212 (-) Transcript_99069:255-890(-)
MAALEPQLPDVVALDIGASLAGTGSQVTRSDLTVPPPPPLSNQRRGCLAGTSGSSSGARRRRSFSARTPSRCCRCRATFLREVPGSGRSAKRSPAPVADWSSNMSEVGSTGLLAVPGAPLTSVLNSRGDELAVPFSRASLGVTSSPSTIKSSKSSTSSGSSRLAKISIWSRKKNPSGKGVASSRAMAFRHRKIWLRASSHNGLDLCVLYMP